MHDDIKFKATVDSGFNLPSAYRSHDSRLHHMVAWAILVSSTVIAAVTGAQIVGLI